ncbi:MAG: hypothetical protein AAF405_02665 [Pseudomonadota bacterium]
MRDIRGDLQDRAGFLEEQISAAQVQFDKRMELFAREHETKINDLRAELEAVNMLMEREYRRIMTVPDAAPEPAELPAAAPAAMEDYGEPEYVEASYEDDLLAASAEEEFERETAEVEAEPAPRAVPAESERPVRRAPEPYADETASRAEEAAPPRRLAEARPAAPQAYRRPENQTAERQPAPQAREQAPSHRDETAAHAHDAPRRRQEAPRQEAARQEAPRQQVPRQEAPLRRAAEPRELKPAQRQPLADFLIRKLGEIGTSSLDELCSAAIQEGYFAEGDHPDRSVHMTLMNVVKAGFIRQLPNGAFAPASVMDTIRLRRAI